jgi:cold shock CspA family protein
MKKTKDVEDCPEELDSNVEDVGNTIEYSGWITGYLKWFNSRKGFGFVQIKYKGEVKDAFIHISALKDNKILPDYTPVKVVVVNTKDGLKVIKLKEVILDE